MLFVFTGTDRDGHLSTRLANRDAHIAWLGDNAERIHVGGPLLAEDGETMIGSMLVIEADSEAEARAPARHRPLRHRRSVRHHSVARLAMDRRQARLTAPATRSGRHTMAYWLFKSEPGTWSWDDQVAAGGAGAEWDGIRNYQARNNMREMKLGRSRGFFYHSVNEKQHDGRGRGHRLEISHPDSTTDDPNAGNAWTSSRGRSLSPRPSLWPWISRPNPKPRPHGAGQQYPPLRPAGEAGGMEDHPGHGRPEGLTTAWTSITASCR